MKENDENKNIINNKDDLYIDGNEKETNNNDLDEYRNTLADIKGFKNVPEIIKIERVKDNINTYDRSIKVILIGDCNVGKTSILRRLTDNKFNEKYLPSKSLEYTNYSIKINNYTLRMQIWDTSGQEKYESGSIILNYYKTAEVAIFIYAINDLNSYNNINNYINDLYDNDEQNHIKKILLGNKQDLNDERKVEYTNAQKFSQNNKFDYFEEISCKTENSKKNEYNNIQNIFNYIGRIFYEENSRLSHSSSINQYSASSSVVESRNQNNESAEWKKCCIACNIL